MGSSISKWRQRCEWQSTLRIFTTEASKIENGGEHVKKNAGVEEVARFNVALHILYSITNELKSISKILRSISTKIKTTNRLLQVDEINFKPINFNLYIKSFNPHIPWVLFLTKVELLFFWLEYIRLRVIVGYFFFLLWSNIFFFWASYIRWLYALSGAISVKYENITTHN